MNNSAMDFNEVAVFIRVVQKGSFSAAAVALDMPKSTVSTKVASLERRLGTTLLKRSTRKLSLTQDGEMFFRRATRGIDEILAAGTDVRAENKDPHGRLRLTAPVDLGSHILAELTTAFLKKYPKVHVEIFLSDRYVDFLEDGIDLAIRAGALKDSSLIAKKIGDIAFGIYASPKYLKANGTPASPKELVTHDCVLFSAMSAVEWKLQSGKRLVSVSLPGRVVVNDINLAHSFAVRGEGVTLLPSFLCHEDVKAGRLVRVLNEWHSSPSPIHFVYPAQPYVQPALKMFIEMSIDILRSRFQPIEN